MSSGPNGVKRLHEAERYSDGIQSLLSMGQRRGYVAFNELNHFCPPDKMPSSEVERLMMALNERAIPIVADAPILERTKPPQPRTTAQKALDDAIFVATAECSEGWRRLTRALVQWPPLADRLESVRDSLAAGDDSGFYLENDTLGGPAHARLHEDVTALIHDLRNPARSPENGLSPHEIEGLADALRKLGLRKSIVATWAAAVFPIFEEFDRLESLFIRGLPQAERIAAHDNDLFISLASRSAFPTAASEGDLSHGNTGEAVRAGAAILQAAGLAGRAWSLFREQLNIAASTCGATEQAVIGHFEQVQKLCCQLVDVVFHPEMPLHSDVDHKSEMVKQKGIDVDHQTAETEGMHWALRYLDELRRL